VILLDSFGWLEYFADCPLVEKYASYVEQVCDDRHDGTAHDRAV
jgi:hypothetical protein